MNSREIEIFRGCFCTQGKLVQSTFPGKKRIG